MPLFLPTQKDIAALKAMLSKQTNMRGTGVGNTPSGITVSPMRPIIAPTHAPKAQHRLGIVTAATSLTMCEISAAYVTDAYVLTAYTAGDSRALVVDAYNACGRLCAVGDMVTLYWTYTEDALPKRAWYFLPCRDGRLWCPSMNFVVSRWGATANQYCDMKGVVLGWPASPYDPAGMGDSGGIMVRHAGILRGITLTFYSSGDSSKLTFTVVRYTGGGASALTSAPVSAASVTAGGYVRMAINTTESDATVAQGDILYLQVKTSDTISNMDWYVSAFVTLDIDC